MSLDAGPQRRVTLRGLQTKVCVSPLTGPLVASVTAVRALDGHRRGAELPPGARGPQALRATACGSSPPGQARSWSCRGRPALSRGRAGGAPWVSLGSQADPGWSSSLVDAVVQALITRSPRSPRVSCSLMAAQRPPQDGLWATQPQGTVVTPRPGWGIGPPPRVVRPGFGCTRRLGAESFQSGH